MLAPKRRRNKIAICVCHLGSEPLCERGPPSALAVLVIFATSFILNIQYTGIKMNVIYFIKLK